MCLSLMFGFTAVLIGVLFPFAFSNSDPIFNAIYSIALYIGVSLIILGFALVPGVRKTSNVNSQILEITAVRKEVTISEISQETGLDRELVRDVLTKFLVRGFLFGYIEGDLFVRDTAGRPRYPIRGQRGLFEANE